MSITAAHRAPRQDFALLWHQIRHEQRTRGRGADAYECRELAPRFRSGHAVLEYPETEPGP